MIAKKYTVFLAATVLGGCASIGLVNLNDMFGESKPRDRIVHEVATNRVDYWSDVKPILETRCVSCHACYDAPCQLKLSSIEGIERGASKELVYNAARFKAVLPTRLFEDAKTVAEWRNRDFHPVLNEHSQTLVANREAGVMYQMLTLKESYSFPVNQKLGDEFEFDIDRDMSCAAPEESKKFAADHPEWGMPYAFPALSNTEQGTLKKWLDEGATYTARPALKNVYQSKIAEWENFLNGDSNKHQLMSRYVYEHLFLGHLYFNELTDKDAAPNHYFQIVRSVTPPGQPIDLITTRKPYDDPGVNRVYYRIQVVPGTIVAKTHMPYALNPRRLAFWRELFIDKAFDVPELPGYSDEIGSNPFLAFQHLPVSSRYNFMLDEAQFTIMGFIKGPVCRGQVALNVIRDHFWVVFVAPHEAQDHVVSEFYKNYRGLLALPGEAESSSRPLRTWRKYSKKYSELGIKYDEFLDSHLVTEIPYNLDLIWDGNGNNKNAALTVLRHFDSATVEQGLIGNPPKTTWLIGYTDLERIHYLLVAGYDVYGNLGHQLLSRLYMDFLRMSSESSFLLLLPEEARKTERQLWYRGADPELFEFLKSPTFESGNEPDIFYQTNNAKFELYEKIKARLGPAVNQNRQISRMDNDAMSAALSPVNQMQGDRLGFLPEHSLVMVESTDHTEVFTIVRNNAHSNVTSMFSEQKNRTPSEDTMMVMKGFVGSYPGALFKLKKDDVEAFVDLVGRVNSDDTFQVLVNQFGVRRTNPDFWSISDELNRLYLEHEPINYGVLDYNRFGNY